MKLHMKLEKGMLVSVDSCWYVLVEIVYYEIANSVYLNCICDHANNTHSFKITDVHSYLTLEEIKHLRYEKPDRKIAEPLQFREIPYEVITEVLLGRADNKFK